MGQQDGDVDRPFYDGMRYRKTVSSVDETKTKLGITKKLETAKTWQLRQSVERIDTTVKTDITHPNTLTEYQLQKQEQKLEKKKMLKKL